MSTTSLAPNPYATISSYTDKDTLLLDLDLYRVFKTNQTLTLDLFPQIAVNRWSYIVNAWPTSLSKVFLDSINGDGYLLNSYTQLQNAIYASSVDPNYNPLTDRTFYQEVQDFLALLTLDSLRLTPLETDIVNKEKQRISKFTIATFQAMISFLRIEKANAFDQIGLGNSKYNSWIGRKGLAVVREYFLSDLDIIQEMINLENKILGIIVTLKRTVITDPNLLAFSNRNINPGSGVQVLDIYRSYTMMPFEQSLEVMAVKYLGDIQRKYEIITVNNLKAPFVDQQGLKVPLLGNGTANSIVVPNTFIDRCRVGATVRVGSRITPETTRKILKVVDNKINELILFLSGDNTLGSLLQSQGAYLRCYAPDTLQDFSFVRIPSTVTPKTPPLSQPSISEIRKLDDALIAFGVDIASDPITRDWQSDLSGNIKLAYGMTNVAQAIRNIMRVPTGSLSNHPNYGIKDSTGDQFTRDVPTKVSGDIQASVLRDPRIVSMRINELTVTEEGVIVVSSAVKIAGAGQYLPLSFNR
jgi:phage baseplate assembly protein W